MRRRLSDEAATRAMGERLAGLLTAERRWLITLAGELGAGKTTLVRGLLAGFGHRGAARSPTYTLLEPYRLGEREVLHLDLYRLGDPAELEYLGLRDLLTGHPVLIVEWPERGRGYLPAADVAITLGYEDRGRRFDATGVGAAGAELVRRLGSQGK